MALLTHPHELNQQAQKYSLHKVQQHASKIAFAILTSHFHTWRPSTASINRTCGPHQTHSWRTPLTTACFLLTMELQPPRFKFLTHKPRILPVLLIWKWKSAIIQTRKSATLTWCTSSILALKHLIWHGIVLSMLTRTIAQISVLKLQNQVRQFNGVHKHGTTKMRRYWASISSL